MRTTPTPPDPLPAGARLVSPCSSSGIARHKCRPWIALLAVIVLGCAAATHRHGAAAPAATSQSSGPRQVALSAALPIERFRDDSHDIDLRNQLSFPKTGDVYFGQADTYEGDPDTATATLPLIVAASKGAWVAIDLHDT